VFPAREPPSRFEIGYIATCLLVPLVMLVVTLTTAVDHMETVLIASYSLLLGSAVLPAIPPVISWAAKLKKNRAFEHARAKRCGCVGTDGVFFFPSVKGHTDVPASILRPTPNRVKQKRHGAIKTRDQSYQTRHEEETQGERRGEEKRRDVPCRLPSPCVQRRTFPIPEGLSYLRISFWGRHGASRRRPGWCA
jgi:hypothetical protein